MFSSIFSTNVSTVTGGGSTREIYSDTTDANIGLGKGLAFHADAEDNVAFGENALNSTTGAALQNVAIGTDSLTALTLGDYNVAVGYQSGAALSDQVTGCVIIGRQALGLATAGVDNCIAIGYRSMYGDFGTAAVQDCIAIGVSSLRGVLTAGADKTIAIGTSSLRALTSGANNLAIGYQAMLEHQTGDANVVIGNDAMNDSNNHAGYHNTFIGTSSGAGGWAGAAHSNTAVGSGSFSGGAKTAASIYNVAVGRDSLLAVTSGASNVAVGYQAGVAMTTNTNNVALGYQALAAADLGEDSNVAIGHTAMSSVNNTASDNNVSIGYSALNGGTGALIGCIAIGRQALDGTATNAQTGTIAIGDNSLGSLTTGSGNIAIGYQAADGVTTGDKNIAIGYAAMGDAGGATVLDSDNNIFIGYNSGGGTWVTAKNNENVGIGNYTLTGAMNSAVNNTAIGYSSGSAITTGDSNTFIGSTSGYLMTTGSFNVAVGRHSLLGHTTGSRNIAIGYGAMDGTAGDVDDAPASTDNIFIGYDAGGGDWEDDADSNFNIGIGNYSMDAAMNGALRNTAVGHSSLSTLGLGDDNVSFGYNSLAYLGAGSKNTAVGTETMASANGTENYNVAIGYRALYILDGADDGHYNTAVGYYADVDTVTESYSTKLGAYGAVKYKSGRFSLTAAHTGVDSVILELFKIPALSIINRVSCSIIQLSNLGTYAINLSLSTVSDSTADDALVNASTTITVPEILGRDAANTYAKASTIAMAGTAADINLASGGTLKTCFTNQPTTTIVGISDTYLYACNATNNGTTSGSTAAIIEVVVEYIGID